MHGLAATMLPAGVTIDVDLDRDLWPVRVDTNQMENVLLNLIVNARDAMPDGGRIVSQDAQRGRCGWRARRARGRRYRKRHRARRRRRALSSRSSPQRGSARARGLVSVRSMACSPSPAARSPSTPRREPERRSASPCLVPSRCYEIAMPTVLIVEDEDLVREIARSSSRTRASPSSRWRRASGAGPSVARCGRPAVHRRPAAGRGRWLARRAAGARTPSRTARDLCQWFSRRRDGHRPRRPLHPETVPADRDHRRGARTRRNRRRLTPTRATRAASATLTACLMMTAREASSARKSSYRRRDAGFACLEVRPAAGDLRLSDTACPAGARRRMRAWRSPPPPSLPARRMALRLPAGHSRPIRSFVSPACRSS